MTFVDLGAWFALTVPDDADYLAARRWFDQNREPLLTSDYVVDETLTLLQARGERHRAVTLGRLLFGGSYAEVRYFTRAEIAAGWEVFERFSDKQWSFTDCTSKALMETLGIRRAFAFDQHFRQFGGVEVVP